MKIQELYRFCATTSNDVKNESKNLLAIQKY